jgi:vacuolar-type H+-ATPase subunit E/Vma4
VSAIANETGAELTKAVESKLAEAQQAFAQAMDTLSKNAPAGTESAVAVLKNALTTSQTAIESAQTSAKKALEMAETSFTAATEQAISAATSLGKKA